MSALVNLPDPEPPPIHAAAIDSAIAKEQPRERTKPVAAPLTPEPSPDKLEQKTETLRKPPPLPRTREDRSKPLAEAIARETLAEIVTDEVAPVLLPKSGSSSEAVPATEHEPATAHEPATGPQPKTVPQHVDEAAPPTPELETDDVEIPVRGYEADRDKVATVRWLAAALLITSLIGIVPAIIDVVEHSLSDTSDGLSRWACGLLLVGVLQCAYAIYLIQLPDWSSVWVVTGFTLVIAASYAAMFGLTLLSSDQGHFVQILDLADRLRGGKATAWCLIMLSLMSLTSYFSGRVGARWRNAFVG